MKKPIFVIKKPAGRKNARLHRDLRYLIRRWGLRAAFTLALLVGLAVGTVSFGALPKDTLLRLDLLFTTNLPERLSGNAFTAFSASFASDFLFFVAAVVLGLSLWGGVLLPLVSFFKGFGIGISAGYLISGYGLRGAVFYLVVMLPGLFVFSMALVYELSLSFGIFRRMASALFTSNKYGFRDAFAYFLRNSLRYLVVTFGASVLDALLWSVLAGLFKFT